ncbi:LysR substrate-binding domain-containing protein [Variovorax sp. J22R24]|uniref:LysR substrate-binding domain-containing protein n=1 Tax=Variovorax gracilis TaxID=3053502 RepID=UPI0025791422|nr:LysR substrate-binding domain-containing protein [Variovorax sp. J22R24]MDM0108770.1 LysR substrate-binding domain-containing protein [Variovorax sp. J22R24]
MGGHHRLGIGDRPNGAHHFNANDYNLLIQMVLSDQGVALGWDHLVSPLVQRGQLVRPVEQEVVLEETRHYLAFREDKADDDALRRFRSWFLEQSDIALAA